MRSISFYQLKANINHMFGDAFETQFIHKTSTQQAHILGTVEESVIDIQSLLGHILLKNCAGKCCELEQLMVKFIIE